MGQSSSWECSHIDGSSYQPLLIHDSEKAILEKLVKWKDNRVYKSVEYNNQKLIFLWWVYSSRIVNGNKKIKAWLEAKGYIEGNNSMSDFLRPALKNVYVSYNTYHAMDDAILWYKISFFTVILVTDTYLKV